MGEVKWSEKPFDEGEIKALARLLKSRKKPTCLPSAVDYALFLPEVESEAMRKNGFDGVSILTAEDCLEDSVQ